MLARRRLRVRLTTLILVIATLAGAALLRVQGPEADTPRLELIGDASAEPLASPSRTPEAEQRELIILNYRSISLNGEYGSLGLAVFHRQMQYLAELGLKPVSLPDVLAWHAGKKSLSPGSILICFDTASDDFVRYALPVLHLLNYPAAVLADERNLQSVPGFLTPRRLSNLQQRGIHHICATLHRLSPDQWALARRRGTAEFHRLVEEEIIGGVRAFRESFGHCEALALPPGLVKATNLTGELAAESCTLVMAEGKSPTAVNAPGAELVRFDINSSSDFARALSGGDTSRQSRIYKALAAVTLPDGSPGTDGWQPVTDVDAEIAEAADPDFMQTDEVLEPTYGRLARRHGDGDWVTTRFAAPLVPRDKTRVAVLGYHNFSNKRKPTEMLMRTSEFCTQMQYIRDAGLSVISMQDFLEWRRGRRCLPERCVLITIDDGWKSVYSDAYPVLKAYGYPFTLFLYTRYIDVQGDSMTVAMIREMTEHGATIGSHSSNHLYPREWKRNAQDSPAYEAMLKREIIDSGDRLAKLFAPTPCSAYCYPGGYNTPPMLETLKTSRYKAAFTVLEKKVSCTEPVYLTHRYMVFGTEPSIFRRAVNFDGTENAPNVRRGLAEAEPRARAFFPAAFPADPASSASSASSASPAASTSPAAPPKKSSPALPPDEDIAVDPDEDVAEDPDDDLPAADEVSPLPPLPSEPVGAYAL